MVDGDQDTCADDFGFFMIKAQTGLAGVDGIVGLAPAIGNTGPSFIQSLYDQGKIEQKIVSFQINLKENDSFIVLGGYNDNDYKGDMFMHPLIKDQATWWTVSFDDIQYDGKSIKDSPIDLAIIDSGTSFIYLAQSDYLVFID
jgi:hypothetical protein